MRQSDKNSHQDKGKRIIIVFVLQFIKPAISTVI